MSERLCPTCNYLGRLLPDSSTGAQVEYDRCDSCGTVWAHDKDDRLAPARIVLRPKSRSAQRSRRQLRIPETRPPTPNPPN